MPAAGSEPAIPVSKQPRTHILNRAVTGMGMLFTRCCVPVLLNFTWQFPGVVCSRTRDGVYLEAGFFYPSYFDSWLLWSWSLQTGLCTLLSKCEHWSSFSVYFTLSVVQSSWNVMAHGDAREGKCRGNWRMEWVASTLHTTSEHGVSSITTADAHTSAASSRLDWRPRRFKWTRPFRRKTKSGFCACAITFQTQST
jgi:hypothetical protein